MLPGQEINKDVYAVNTGNIAAFVKENVKGVLNYTYETIVDEFDATKAVELSKSTVLAIDGATTNEAGGFLAWTNAKTPATTTYKVGEDVYTITDEEVEGYVGTENKTLVKMTCDGKPDLYIVKAAEYNTDDTVYTTPGTRPVDAVAPENATLYGTSLTAETGPVYKVGEDVYTIGAEVDGYVGDTDATFVTLKSDGKPDLYLVKNTSYLTGTRVYSDVGTRATAAQAAVAAEPNATALTVEEGGNATAITAGSINSRRLDPNGTDTGVVDDRWTPPESGVYIFRRTINTKDDGATLENPKFTYAGYYYDKENDKYYKIVIGNDDPAATKVTKADGSIDYVFDINAESGSLGINSDLIDPVTGEIDPSANLRIRYVNLNKVENAVPTFEYVSKADSTVTDSTGAKQPYLLATYYDPAEGNAAVQAEIDAKKAAYDQAVEDLATAENTMAEKSNAASQAEVNYQKALGEYNSAKSRYDQTKADYDYAKALAKAQNDLIDAANTRADKQNEYDKAAADLQKAAKALTEAAGAVFDDITGDGNWLGENGLLETADDFNISPTKLIPAATRTAINNYHGEYDEALAQVKNNITLLDEKYTEIQGYAKTVYQKLNYLKSIEDDATLPDHFTEYATSEDVQAAYDALATAKAQLDDALADYQDLYNEIQYQASNVSEANLTGLTFASASAVDTFMDTTNGTYKNLNLGSASSGIQKAVNDYVSKYNDYRTMYNTTIPNADSTWEKAVSDYNEAVTTAKGNYEEAVGKEQPMPNYFVNGKVVHNGGTLYDHGATLVTYSDTANAAGYSASDKTDGDPTIDSDSSYTLFTNKTYTNGTGYDDVPTSYAATTGARNVKQTPNSEATFAQIAQTTSKQDSEQVSTNKALGVFKGGDVTETTENSLAAEVERLEGLLNTKAVANNDKGFKGIYDKAVKDYEDAVADYEAAQLAANNAQAAYDGATSSLRSTIKIKVVLDKDAEDYWTIDPADLPTSNDVDFYYNYVLEAGETSHKLIDYVVLDDSVTSTDYKDLVFDLNVGLDSVQVTYDADQRNYTSEAVNAADATFALDVKSPEIIPNDTTKLTWGTATP